MTKLLNKTFYLDLPNYTKKLQTKVHNYKFHFFDTTCNQSSFKTDSLMKFDNKLKDRLVRRLTADDHTSQTVNKVPTNKLLAKGSRCKKTSQFNNIQYA